MLFAQFVRWTFRSENATDLTIENVNKYDADVWGHFWNPIFLDVYDFVVKNCEYMIFRAHVANIHGWLKTLSHGETSFMGQVAEKV